jgi:hypothetical protein
MALEARETNSGGVTASSAYNSLLCRIDLNQAMRSLSRSVIAPAVMRSAMSGTRHLFLTKE